MRIALVHYWLLKMRGGEKVLESFCRLLPDADIFTLFYDPESVTDTIRSHKVIASFLNPLRRHYRHLLPLMPLALEHFDLRDYDLVISSESGPAKGVMVPSSSYHVCYCHTPMRYLWDLYPAYLREWTVPRWKRAFMEPLANYLRLWDYASAARVDEFIANSANTQRRILRSYRRESSVVYPPVDIETFYWQPPEDFYLAVGEFVAYKRFDMAVRVCSATGRRLLVVGDGPEYRKLKKCAGPTVEFCGRVSDPDLHALYARCRALIIPGEEDFGMTPVEALASGKPVIALARGGVMESVPTRNPFGGILYPDATDDALRRALERFERLESTVRSSELQAQAAQFSEARFHMHLRRILPLDAPRLIAAHP